MIRFILSTLLIIVTSFTVTAGGPWVKGKKNGYFQLSFTSLQYNELLNGFQDPNSGLKREVTDLTLQAYLEYGLGKNWQVEFAIPFKMLKTGDHLLDAPGDLYPADTLAAGKMNSFGNIQAAAKYLILDGKYKLSGKLTVGANTADYDSLTGLRSGYDAWYFAPSFSVGRGYSSFYYFTEAGYRFKTNGYSNDFLFTLEAGFKFNWVNTYDTWLILVMDAVIPATYGHYEDGSSVQTALYQDHEGYVSPGIKLNQQLTPNLYLNFAIYGAIWADHHGAAPTLNAALAWDW